MKHLDLTMKKEAHSAAQLNGDLAQKHEDLAIENRGMKQQ